MSMMTRITIEVEPIEEKEFPSLVPEPKGACLEIYHNDKILGVIPGQLFILEQIETIIISSYTLGREDVYDHLHDEWDEFRRTLEL